MDRKRDKSQATLRARSVEVWVRRPQVDQWLECSCEDPDLLMT